MIESQSVLVETIAFLMQFSPAGSLQQQSNKTIFYNTEHDKWKIFSRTLFFPFFAK